MLLIGAVSSKFLISNVFERARTEHPRELNYYPKLMIFSVAGTLSGLLFLVTGPAGWLRLDAWIRSHSGKNASTPKILLVLVVLVSVLTLSSYFIDAQLKRRGYDRQ